MKRFVIRVIRTKRGVELDISILLLGILSTFAGLYGLHAMLTFKREVLKINAHQKHLDRINKLAVRKMGIKAKTSNQGGDLSEVIGNIAENLDSDDVDDLPIPGWLKPLAKGYIEKMMDKRGSVDEEEPPTQA